MKYKNIKLWGLFLALVAIGVLVAMNFAFGQFDYYDPYSNSNIDYFPTNPINTSPSRTNRNTGGTVSTPKSTPEKTPISAPVSVPCTNKPKPNPTNTRSVEIRDKDGKVFYLSPPKEEVIGIRAYPETSQKIFKIIYDDSGMQKDETEIGLIEVDNKCYPKYGYIQDDAPAPKPTQSASIPDNVVPSNRTAARLDPETGKVYNEKTNELIPDARYDVAARKIYYKDTESTFGKVFTETTGYVNIEIKNCSKKTALQFNEEQPYYFCYRSDAILVGIMPWTADLKVTSPDGPVNVLNITYYKNSGTVDDVMKNWYRVKKKKVKNKYNISGFTYTLRDADPSAPLHYGAFLINNKSDGQEFVHIQLTDTLLTDKFPKEFKMLIKTFRFNS
ncbi:hypothetical protein HYW83_05465 [Candidatus Peregrinibacteria bacterium]|nr:hypothetical protein [Candidatus Peregrinibacteria bacterium]